MDSGAAAPLFIRGETICLRRITGGKILIIIDTHVDPTRATTTVFNTSYRGGGGGGDSEDMEDDGDEEEDEGNEYYDSGVVEIGRRFHHPRGDEVADRVLLDYMLNWFRTNYFVGGDGDLNVSVLRKELSSELLTIGGIAVPISQRSPLWQKFKELSGARRNSRYQRRNTSDGITTTKTTTNTSM